MLQPGQCTIGTLELSEKYPVSSATINKTLKIFAELDMIEYEPSSQKSLITINNWELYQELMPYAKNSTIMIKAKDKHKTGNVESTDNQAVCEVLSADNTQNINIVSTDNPSLTDNNNELSIIIMERDEYERMYKSIQAYSNQLLRKYLKNAV